MLEKLKYFNDKEILSIINNRNVKRFRNKVEIKELVNIYKLSKRDEMVLKLIKNCNFLFLKSIDDHINLIEEYIKVSETFKNKIEQVDFTDVESSYNCLNKFKSNLFNIITNNELLCERTCNEMIALLNAYLKENKILVDDVGNVNIVKNFSYDIITNDLLLSADIEEQLKMIEKYSNPSDDKVFNKISQILKNEKLFLTRSYEEIDKLLEKYKETYDENIFEMIINEVLLENRTYSEQMELIFKYKKLNGNEFARLFTDEDILEYRSHYQQLELIYYYLNNNRSDIYELIISESLLKNRTYNEQIVLMDKYLSIPSESIFNILLDENVSKVVPYKFQLNIINNCVLYDKKNQELENLKQLIVLLKKEIEEKDLKINELEKTKYKK